MSRTSGEPTLKSAPERAKGTSTVAERSTVVWYPVEALTASGIRYCTWPCTGREALTRSRIKPEPPPVQPISSSTAGVRMSAFPSSLACTARFFHDPQYLVRLRAQRLFERGIGQADRLLHLVLLGLIVLLPLQFSNG